jgi:hypothetical protein
MELEWKQKAKHLENFMQKLKNSGYDETFRLEILKSSINGYEKIEKEPRKENKDLMNFQIIEQTGVSLERLFQKSNPFREKDCGKQDCVVCDGKGVKCRDEGVGYRGVCKECRRVNRNSEYIGETGKNAYT